MTDRSVRDHDAPRAPRHAAPKQPNRLARSAFQTLPILLAGSMAMTAGLTGPIDASGVKRADRPQDANAQLRKAVIDAMNQAASDRANSATPAVGEIVDVVPAATVPATYRVAAGDTVSAIAARFGLATASVLALNGLGWSTLIFPGQVLRLSSAAATTPKSTPPKTTPPATGGSTTTYTIVRGDTVSAIAARFGVSTQSVLTANGLGWSTIIYPGQKLRIPTKASSTPAPTTPAPTTPAPGADPAPTIDIDPVVDVTPIEDAPASEPAPAPTTTSYVIKSGDTITSIAARFGVSIQSILSANGLTMSSIIYAGRTLVIPGVSSGTAGVGGSVTPLTAEMRTNAKTIIAVGRSLGVSDYGLVIALAAAMQESGLRNLDYGDRDSLGLFQQRPSTGWGTPAQVTDPVYASKLFFGGPSNPNKGKTRGLLDIKGWQSMTVTQAAQAVQISAYPNAYAKWETSARAWLAELS
jgi:LysM repeat protein